MEIGAKHYTFKLGHEVSDNSKHLNHLRWIISNKSKYLTPQGQETKSSKDEEWTNLDITGAN